MLKATIENVSDTAFWIAHYRAVETQRADALFRDPLAAVLVGDRGRRIAEALPRSFITSWVVAVRTRIIDEFIQAAVAEGVDTVLNLGAGLDTRPYRMNLPTSLHWIETDYPAMIDYKTEALAGETPRFRLTRVKCDLADAAERKGVLASANAQAKKMLVLTEGVVPYLSNEEVGALADDLRALDSAAYWIVDRLSPALLKHRKKTMADHLENAPFKFNPEEWFAFFAQHGWRSREVRNFGDESERFGRKMQLPMPVAIVTAVRGLFVSRAARDRFKNAAGYVLLEPR